MKTDLKAEFEKRGPWVFQFRIGDHDYGGGVSAVGDPRLDAFFRFAPEVETILELGALEGAQTFIMANRPGVKRILALEGREKNLQKARFLQEVLQVRNVEFAQANLEHVELARFGTFDAVFCCGLLYHLPEPWQLLKQLPAIAPVLFLWTIYAPDAEAQDLGNGLRGKIHAEGGPDEPLSGLSPTATWLTLDSLRTLLASYGYKRIEVLDDNPAHANGAVLTIGATTGSEQESARR
jgi:hypothetical protein